MNIPFSEVRQRIGGIKGVVRALDGHCLNGDRVMECPFCGAKRGKAGFFTKEGTDFFKCHAKDCSSGGEVMVETSYIAAREGLSAAKPEEGGPSPAYERLLKLAGCWREPEEKKKAEGEKRKSEKAESTPPAPVPPPAEPENHLPELPEDLVLAAKRLILKERSTSVRLLRDYLKLGTDRAVAVLEELERQGVVGPARVGVPRAILMNEAGEKILPSADGVPTDGEAAGVAARDGSAVPVIGLCQSEHILWEAVELFRMIGPETHPTAGRLEKYLNVDEMESRALMARLRELGVLGGDDAVVKLPERPAGLMVFKDANLDTVSFEWGGVKVEESKPKAPAAPAREKEEEKESVRPGVLALRAFFELLTPTDSQMAAFLPGGPVPDPLPGEVLRRLKFKPVSLYEKRGLTPLTCAELAFRANPRRNEVILKSLADRFSYDELVASGLWLEADRKRKLPRRINTQFCGKGQVGKKPKAERRGNDDEWQWGWSEPVLLPYFDALGQVIKLRPHKGGAKASTIAGEEHIYVPRRWKTAGDTVEKFEEVVICEGEYKAAAIWQTIGLGADDLFGQPAMGVCALPGISFAKSVAMRGELDDWLREVECKKVYVAFDDEDNSHKPMRQRFDAQIFARYLAADLNRKLHLKALVVTLPREWRNAKGKADWDGALAKLVQAEAVLDAVPVVEEAPPETLDGQADEWASPE